MTGASWVDVGGGATTYLVGGAVRDQLLGRSPTEFDWVVVGSTPEAMLDQGFNRVGRDFPVFLEPKTGQQYALARTERRTGPGHADFVCHAASDVTLEEDLARRDLTINAMARDRDGTLIDPHNGQRDIDDCVLRHVSPAFAEDPLRVFRVARFAAQLPGFDIAADTLALMRSMVDELAALSGERVFAELQKAPARNAPSASSRRSWPSANTTGSGESISGRLPISLARWRLRMRRRPSSAWAGSTMRRPRRVCIGISGRRGGFFGAQSRCHAMAGCWSRPHAAEALLDALTGIDAFRQNDVTGAVLDGVEACTGESMAGTRRLIDELGAMRVDAEPGPEYGEALRRRRIEWIANRSP